MDTIYWDGLDIDVALVAAAPAATFALSVPHLTPGRTVVRCWLRRSATGMIRLLKPFHRHHCHDQGLR